MLVNQYGKSMDENTWRRELNKMTPHIINSLSHVVWVQILFVAYMLIFICITAALLARNRILSRKIKDLQWAIKYLNQPKFIDIEDTPQYKSKH